MFVGHFRVVNTSDYGMGAISPWVDRRYHSLVRPVISGDGLHKVACSVFLSLHLRESGLSILTVV